MTSVIFPTIWLLLTLSISCTHAFIFESFTPFAALNDLANHVSEETETRLRIRLNIGKSKNPNDFANSPRMFLDGLHMELMQTSAPKGQHVTLPGANGPHPKTSSGARDLKIHHLPYFIGLNGIETIQLYHGAWEMVWREGSKSGVLVCGFDVPETVARNDASIPKGRMYVSFPVWTPELLKEQQAAKAEAEATAAQFVEEKHEMLRKYQDTNNLFMKAWYYRNAVAAVEKLDFTHLDYYSYIPSTYENVVQVHDGLFASNTGNIFNIANDFFQTKTLIGQAVIHDYPNPQSSTSQ